MKFSLQYAKILSQKYLNIDDDIIPEIEMCLEREGDKVNLPYEVEEFGIPITGNGYGNSYGNSYGYGDSYGDGYGYGDGYSNGYGYGNGNSKGNGYGYIDGNGNGNGNGYGY